MQNKLSNPVLDWIMTSLTFLGDYCLIWLIITILFYMNGDRKYAYLMVGTMLVTNAINNGLIKSIFRRKRPFEIYDDITIFIPEPYGSSFPSGHSATGFCCAVVIAYYNSTLGIIALTLAALIAFSRMYLRVHFFSDVMVGMIVGCLCSIVLMGYFG
ncbi:MAG: phosphatase PAP2 family protein [Erysipelotrichia bacterium]|nr:phosphatase PAP2 family protein [Erysipelotrichia bacterium]